MAVKLRLKRMGAKKAPFYRIVAAESRSPRDGRFIEIVGTYDPVGKGEQVSLKTELIMKWLEAGAQPTDTVRDIFSEAGIMQRFHEQKGEKAAAAKVDKPKKAAKAPKTEGAAKAKSTATEKATKDAAKQKETTKATSKSANKPATKKTATKTAKKTTTTKKAEESAKASDAVKPNKA